MSAANAVPLDAAMIAGVVLMPAVHDVTQAPNARELAHMVSWGGMMAAYHWACHHYLKNCPFNVWHED